MNTKACITCKRELPVTNEFFPKRKDSKDGFRNECKECNKKRLGNYYRDNIEKSKQYCLDNREHILKRKKLYRQKNKEDISKKWKQYYQGNKKRLVEKARLYHQNNKAKEKEYRESNKEMIAEKKRQYQQNNKEKCNIVSQRRRARKDNLIATLTPQQWEGIKQYFNNKCAYCGEELPLEQEHFIPLSKGGEYTSNNMIASCRSCNASKSNADFFEWYPQQRFYSEERKEKILEFLGYKDNVQQLKLI